MMTFARTTSGAACRKKSSIADEAAKRKANNTNATKLLIFRKGCRLRYPTTKNNDSATAASHKVTDCKPPTSPPRGGAAEAKISHQLR